MSQLPPRHPSRLRALGLLSLAATAIALLISSRAAAFTLEATPLIPQLTAQSEVMFLTAPNGDADYVYTGGRFSSDIWVHDRNTGELEGTFLNLPNATAASQDGLLSMAFHPDYASNGLFYTYTFRNDDPFVRIIERRRSDTDPLVADPSYERQILEVPNPNTSHNGGWLGFSPTDGYLYVTTGDGGANQGVNNGLPAQDLFDPHGKILRVDVSGDDFPDDDDKNYSVPATNPYNGTDGLPEIFAYGLRHPFRASFDRLTGDLYIGDVGGSLREEINFLPAGTSGGQNFGWRPKEGSLDNPFFDDPLPPDAIDPIYEYENVGGASVTGGIVYRGDDHPELQGTYLFGDFVDDTFFSFEYDGATLTNFADRTDELFPDGFGGLVAFGEDGLGELYAVDLFDLAVYKIGVEPFLSGDADGDGDVDGDDLIAVQTNFGSVTPPPGDADNDGDVDGDDLIAVQTNFGAVEPLTVPEPTGAAAVALLLLAASTRRSRSA